MSKIDTAMLMAAGLGTRMRPLTDARPKPMVEVAGKPLIDHCLDQMRAAEIRNLVVNVHYLPDQVIAHLSEHAKDFTVEISDERDLLMETGGGLVKAEHLLPAEPFYCINSDNIWIDAGHCSLLAMADAWNSATMDCMLLLVPQAMAHNHRGKGDFFRSDDGKPVRRGVHDSAPFIHTGIQLVSHRLLRDPPPGPFSTNIFWDRAIGEGRLSSVVLDGEWFDIGTPEAIGPTERRLLELSHG